MSNQQCTCSCHIGVYTSAGWSFGSLPRWCFMSFALDDGHVRIALPRAILFCHRIGVRGRGGGGAAGLSGRRCVPTLRLLAITLCRLALVRRQLLLCAHHGERVSRMCHEQLHTLPLHVLHEVCELRGGIVRAGCLLRNRWRRRRWRRKRAAATSDGQVKRCNRPHGRRRGERRRCEELRLLRGGGRWRAIVLLHYPAA